MCQRCGVCAKDVPCVDYAIRVGPEEARLEALAVLLEAARLLAVTALVVAAQRVGVRGAWRRVVDLGSERRGVALECLLDSTLAHLVVLWVVVAGLTVASEAVLAGGETLAVQLQAAVGRSSRRVLGWAQGGCGAGRTIGRLDIPPSWFAGAQRRASREGGLRQKSAWVRPIRYLGECSTRVMCGKGTSRHTRPPSAGAVMLCYVMSSSPYSPR